MMSHHSSVMSQVKAISAMPALQTRISMCPNAATVSATAAAIAALSRTSVTSSKARRPSARTWLAVSSRSLRPASE